MLRRMTVVSTVALVLGLASLPGMTKTTTAQAADSAVTTITVGEMCGGCVKRITAKLEPMEDVAKIRCDVKTNRVAVLPKQGRVLSPRALWEALDEIGKTPKKLSGPSGTFTSKPKN